MILEPVANPWSEKINSAYERGIENIIEIGQLLWQAKKDLPHGEFQHMIRRELRFGPRQAQNYMRVSADSRLSNAKHTSLLPPALDTLATLTRLPDQVFEGGLQTLKINPAMSRKDALALLKESQPLLAYQDMAPFDPSNFYLAATGKQLERLLEEEKLSPEWLKLNKAGAIIEEIAASIRKLKGRAARIGHPGGIEKFQAEFKQMEGRICEMADEYRRLVLAMKRFQAELEASLRHVPGD
jgi:hypothetical protein